MHNSLIDAPGVNPELIKIGYAMVRQAEKRSFVAGGDMSGGGGGAPPGMDPSGGGGGGGAPPGMDPSMMGGGGGMPPGMDPSMMGPPPGGGGGGESDPRIDQILQLLQLLQQQSGGAGSPQSGASAGGMLKPKIDVNVEIMQIKHMLAKISDSLGIHLSAQEMTATPEKLTQMAQAQQGSGQQDAAMGGGSAIQPIEPMQGAMPQGGGKQAAAMMTLHNKAAAIYRMRNQAA